MSKVCPKCNSDKFCLYPFCGKSEINDKAWNWFYNILSDEQCYEIKKKYNAYNHGLNDIVRIYKLENK